MSSIIDLSSDEFSLLSDPDILISKKIIQNKIYRLLENTQTKIEVVLGQFAESLPDNFSHAKISQGENYLNLPYMVLDYPSEFSQKNIFAFRTMFYWGNFFSSTLHLEGKYLEKNRQRLFDATDIFIDENSYISTGISPWHYHYGSDNYQLLSQENCSKFLTDPFIKVSINIKLDNWNNLPEEAAKFLEKVLNIIAG